MISINDTLNYTIDDNNDWDLYTALHFTKRFCMHPFIFILTRTTEVNIIISFVFCK